MATISRDYTPRVPAIRPDRYQPDAGETLREITRLVTEHGLPVPSTLQIYASSATRLQFSRGRVDDVDAWAAHLGVTAAVTEAYPGDGAPWQVYEMVQPDWLGHGLFVWASQAMPVEAAR